MTKTNDSPAGHQADVVTFWRAVELFTPQPVPKASPKDDVYRLGAESEPLPWEDRHPLERRRLLATQAWQHFVYLGVYPLEDAFAGLRQALSDSDPAREDNDPLPTGDSALAVFVVGPDGRALLGSQTLASCAWAIGRALEHGSPSADWLDGFEGTARKFAEAFEELAAAGEDDQDAQALEDDDHAVGRVVNRDLLEQMRELALEFVAADEPEEGNPIRDALEIRISSFRVGQANRYRPATHDFINSFIAQDLKRVADAVSNRDHGHALRRYLSSTQAVTAEANDQGLADVQRKPALVRELLAPAHVPAGRWPSPVAHPASLGPQLAVNVIRHPEVCRDRHGGLLGVNGPPGTGKTTLLRELIAATVVERAEALAELKSPADAFLATPHKFRDGNRPCTVHELKSALTGFEMVLACATNAAAENVSTEIPLLDAIAPEWHQQVDYFSDLATHMLNGPRSTSSEPVGEAWAMIAACLGSKAKCRTFTTAFWWGQKATTPATPDTEHDTPGIEVQHGLLQMLKDHKAQPADWTAAVKDFRTAQKRVSVAREERQLGGQLFSDLDASLADAQRHAAAAQQQASSLEQAQATLAQQREEMTRREAEHQQALQTHEQHGAAKPRLGAVLRSFGAVKRQWRTRQQQLAQQLAHAERLLADAQGRHQQAATVLATTDRQLKQHQAAQRNASAHAEKLRVLIAEVETEWHTTFPGSIFPGEQWAQDSQREHRELQAPWIDETWDRLRTELFLAALRLHKALVLANAAKFRQSLSVAVDVIAASSPARIPDEAALAAWQCLFLTVPLVSTTFASFPRLFRHLGREDIGWLFIDEAGQSTPQNAAGPIWRSKHTIVVGDPLQLEPIVALPLPTQHDLARAHGVDELWLPSHCSVQSLADRTTLIGTHRGGDQDIWVGLPLNVHRRCEQPMFAIVNQIAYDNQMIDHTPPRPPFTPPASAWLHVSGEHSEGHWIAEEGQRLEQLLSELAAVHAVDPEQIFIISPFRDVANRLSGYRSRYPGITAGTVHTAQGKEADIVILILGGNPQREGDKRWASAKPNLLNVAVSRARRRLYVIGNRDIWGGYRYFDAVAERLPVEQARRPLPFA